MSQIAEDFREMKCNREDNFCCGGGGGFNGIGKFRPQRDKGLYMKLQQIRETGAKMVISPCHNCWDAIRDMMEVYHVHDIKWSFLKPIIIDMMIVPSRGITFGARMMTNKEGIEGTRGGGKTFSGFLSFHMSPYSQ